ncbi:MAG: alpha/beta fold hydrolase [Deltaproteobacteria bacterium]|jgi:pimeloyl-ACP methyl ester carboxylesterase|nr:alpha/beta fold hydrolase [Deltaproteobacteria bacterium]
MNRVFIHGLESSGLGTKGQFFRKHYPDMLIEDYEGPFEARMEKLDRLLAGKEDLILVGSSYGGLMAAVYTCGNEERVKKLILLAPALTLPQFDSCKRARLTLPVVVYHGKQDAIVPPEATRKIAEEVFTNLFYHAVTDDHSLHEHFEKMPWDCLLLFRGHNT